MRGASLVKQRPRPRYRCISAQDSSQPRRTDDTSTSIGVADRTFTCWWKPYRMGVQAAVIGKWNSSQEYALGTNITLGRMFLQWTLRNIAGTATVTVTSVIPAAEIIRWNFIQCYYDLTNGLAGLAVNGRPAVTVALVGGVFDGTDSFIIGSNAGAGSGDGYVTRVGTWSRLLTADEVNLVYNGGVPLTYQRLKEKMAATDTNLEAYWNLTHDLNDSGPGGKNLSPFGPNVFTTQ